MNQHINTQPSAEQFGQQLYHQLTNPDVYSPRPRDEPLVNADFIQPNPGTTPYADWIHEPARQHPLVSPVFIGRAAVPRHAPTIGVVGRHRA